MRLTRQTVSALILSRCSLINLTENSRLFDCVRLMSEVWTVQHEVGSEVEVEIHVRASFHQEGPVRII